MIEDSIHDFPLVRTGDILMQRPYLPEDKRWYIQEVGMLDLGRFETQDAAFQHWQYMQETRARH